jgi:hypothetical protein
MSSATFVRGFAGDIVEVGLSGRTLTGGTSRLLDQKLVPVIGLMHFPSSQLNVVRKRQDRYHDDESEQAKRPVVRDIEAIVIRS